MTTKEKYEMIDKSKVGEKLLTILQNMEKSSKNFTDESVNSKIDTALDKIIEGFRASKPEALRTVTEAKKEVKKEKEKAIKKNEGKDFSDKKDTDDKTGLPKKDTVEERKDIIKKESESEKEAKDRAKKELDKEKDKAKEEIESQIDKLNRLILEDPALQGFNTGTAATGGGKSTPLIDAERKALPRGSRVSKKGWKNQYGASKGGRKYWENRENRSDRKSPEYDTGKPYLEKGGNVYSSDDMYEVKMVQDGIELDSKLIRARNKGEAREIFEDWYEEKYRDEFGDFELEIMLAEPKMADGGLLEFKNSIRSSQGNYTYNLTFEPTNNISKLYIEDTDGKKSARFNDIYFSIVEGFAREFEYLMDEYEDEFTQTDWSFDGEVKSAYHSDKKYGASSEKGIFTIFIGDESYKFESEELIQGLAKSFVELYNEIGEKGYDDQKYAKGGFMADGGKIKAEKVGDWKYPFFFDLDLRVGECFATILPENPDGGKIKYALVINDIIDFPNKRYLGHKVIDLDDKYLDTPEKMLKRNYTNPYKSSKYENIAKGNHLLVVSFPQRRQGLKDFIYKQYKYFTNTSYGLSTEGDANLSQDYPERFLDDLEIFRGTLSDLIEFAKRLESSFQWQASKLYTEPTPYTMRIIWNIPPIIDYNQKETKPSTYIPIYEVSNVIRGEKKPKRSFENGGYMEDGGKVSYDFEWRDEEGDTYEASFDTLEDAKEEIRKIREDGGRITETWKYVDGEFSGRFENGGKIKVGDTIFKAWFKNPENSSEKFHKVYVNAKTKIEAENKAKLIDADNFDHVSTPEQIFAKYQIKDIKSDNTPIYDEGGKVFDDDGNEINFKVGDKVVHYRKMNPTDSKKEHGAEGVIIAINDAMGKVLFELTNYEQWYPLKDLKKSVKYAEGGYMEHRGTLIDDSLKTILENDFPNANYQISYDEIGGSSVHGQKDIIVRIQKHLLNEYGIKSNFIGDEFGLPYLRIPNQIVDKMAKGGDVIHFVAIPEYMKEVIAKGVNMGYDTIVEGMITPKKRGIMIINNDYKVRGTFDMELKDAIQNIIDKVKSGEIKVEKEYADGGEIELYYVKDSNGYVKNISKSYEDANKFLEKALKYNGKIGYAIVPKDDWENEKVTSANIQRYADGGDIHDESTQRLDKMRSALELLNIKVKSRIVEAVGIDNAVQHLFRDYDVSPLDLITRAVRNGLLELDEINQDLFWSAIMEAERVTEDYSGEGIGSSDITYFTKAMLDDAGFKTGFVNHRLERLDENGNVLQINEYKMDY